MSMRAVRNEAILASAGFGKTYRLAHRYIRLLACGAAPGQISAVTFSRKAAGEIFDSIVRYLRKAAADPEAAARTAAEIKMPGTTREQFHDLLAVFLHDLHRNRIGTLDSFTVSVIRAFPLELGISPELRLLDNGGSAARLIRSQVLARIFNRRYVSMETQKQFHEAFKQATFGREEKQLVNNLDRFVTDYWDAFQALPDVAAWGNPERIWPTGCPWLKMGEVDTSGDAGRLLELIEERSFPDARIAGGLKKATQALGAYGPTSPWQSDMMNTFVKKLLADPAFPTATTLDIDYYKSFALNEEELSLWRSLLDRVAAIEIVRALKETQGLARVVQQYGELYDPIRRTGQMTFADAQYLLTSANEQSGRAVVSRNAAAADRLYIDYRLDCALDHWLIDEFQDTSDLQWEVVRNLIDEIMQDTSGTRSFFYVGDVKQAIHGWRGGNASLFGKIQKHYGIDLLKADKSHRSCAAVLDPVNRVFGCLPASVSDDVRALWEPIWVHHVPELSSVPSTGYAGLVTATPTGDKGACLEQDRYHATANILREIQPAGRGLSTAVLVRTNDGGKRLVDQLRSECPGIAICHEGRARIADNPVVAVLLSLVKFAAHPGDTLAWRHLQMSPLNAAIVENGYARRDMSNILLRQIHLKGFESFVRHWGQRLDLAESDRFGWKRLGDLAAAAATFDAAGSHNCMEFIAFVSEHEVEEAGTAQTVNVMTIHKSKGLTFDVVILPELESGARGQVDLVMKTASDETRPQWALKMPRKDVAERDEVLRGLREQQLEAEEFEQLCVLYVAMTRSRYATYMVVEPKNSATSPATMLRGQLVPPEGKAPDDVLFAGETFGCLYEQGDRDWFAAVKAPARAAPAGTSLPADFGSRPSQRQPLMRREPSAGTPRKQKASRLFEEKTTDVMQFGTAIHELLERVEWIEDVDVDRIIGEWEPTADFDAPVIRDVIAQFRSCLESPTVRPYLSRPAAGVEPPWIEKRFEIITNGNELVAGAFDRVTILRDADGVPVSATVLDYKSSMIETAGDIVKKAKDYEYQMARYREALAQILHLDESRIRTCLLFTRLAEVFEMS